MNAGAMGSTLYDRVERLWGLDTDGQEVECDVRELAAGYREALWLRTHIALKVALRGTPTPPAQIAATLEAYRQQRRQTQPAGSSAGCVFKNPGPISAGRLIEELGFKGSRIGGAVVSTVHANFILNEGGATAGDILALMARIGERARAERGIELELEVVLIGEET